MHPTMYKYFQRRFDGSTVGLARQKGRPSTKIFGHETVINHVLVVCKIGYRSHSTRRTQYGPLDGLVHETQYRPLIRYKPQLTTYSRCFSRPVWALRERGRGYCLYSGRHDEERHNHTLEGQQRETCWRVNVTGTYRHTYMYSFINSYFFLGSYIIMQNAFTTQANSTMHHVTLSPRIVIPIVCQCSCVQNCFRRHPSYPHHRTAPPAA